jgi:hypothetical protein
MLPHMECTRMNHEEELIKAFFVPTSANDTWKSS